MSLYSRSLSSLLRPLASIFIVVVASTSSLSAQPDSKRSEVPIQAASNLSDPISTPPLHLNSFHESCVVLPNPPKALNIGIHFGLSETYSRYREEDYIPPVFEKHKLGGINFGVNALYNFRPHFSLEAGYQLRSFGFQPRLRKTMLGSDSRGDNRYYLTQPINFWAAQVPLKLRLSSKANGSGWFVALGPTIAHSLGAKTVIDSTSHYFTFPTVTNAPDDSLVLRQTAATTSFVRLGLSYSLGYEHAFNNGSRISFLLDVCYHWGNMGLNGVQYTAGNTDYFAFLTTSGSYSAFSLNYFFRPVLSHN